MKMGKKILKTFFWILGAAAICYLALICFLLFGPKLNSYANRTSFVSADWKSNLDNRDNMKQNMVNDLFSHHQLVGMTRSRIDDLLGKPPRTNYFEDYDYVYWLGPERSALAIDSEWLGIKFEEDVVVKVEILTD